MKRSLEFLALATIVLGLGATSTQAQGYPNTGQAGSATGVPNSNNNMLNMYANPMFNPYLNPMMSGATVGRNDALLYLYAAQQAPGGLLGSKPTSTAPRVAEMHRTGTPPGGGAARYFNRGISSNDRSSKYYQRTNRYFGNNGR